MILKSGSLARIGNCFFLLRSPCGCFVNDSDFPSHGVDSMRRAWTEKELRFLKRYYPDKPTGWLMRRLERSKAPIYGMATTLDLRKSEKYLAGPNGPRLQPGHSRGKTTQFKKGHIPHNKGKKDGPPGQFVENTI
jgi:hypothetical protein